MDREELQRRVAEALEEEAQYRYERGEYFVGRGEPTSAGLQNRRAEELQGLADELRGAGADAQPEEPLTDGLRVEAVA